MFTKTFGELNKNDAAIAGGKGASLGEMTGAGIPVPPGFVVLASAFERFLEETDVNVEIDAILHTVNHREMHTVENASEKIQALILGAKMPKDIATETMRLYHAFKKEASPPARGGEREGVGEFFVAVRSSATAEDSASAAWAGQLDSFLNTTEKDVLKNVQKCWASLFTPRAIFYRFELHDKNRAHGTEAERNQHGTHTELEKVSVAVVVQKMVQSEVSGIAFSVHPVTEDRNQMIIEAGFGLGEAIVSGQITPDSYVVEKAPRRILDKKISEQNYCLIRANKHIDVEETDGAGGGSGSARVELSREKGGKQKLSDEQIFELSELILKIEQHYGFPCDIEWAFAARPNAQGGREGKFYILQSRPITTLSRKVSKEGEKVISKPFDGKDEWMLAENIPDSDIFFFQIPWSCFTDDTSFPFIMLYKEVLSDFHGFAMDFYFGRKDSFEVGESILKALIERPQFGAEVNKNIVVWSKKLIAFAEKVYVANLSNLSNLSARELFSLYEKHDRIHTKLYTYGWLPVAVDVFHNNFTDNLKGYLKTVCSSQAEVEDAFLALTTPSRKTIIADEREEFLKIYTEHLSEIKKIVTKKQKSLSVSFEKALVAHGKEWGHLGYIYAGNAERFGSEHYLDEMVDLVESGITADSILKKEAKQLQVAEAKKVMFCKKLRISLLYKTLFNTAIEFALTKLVCRDAQLRALYALHHSLLPEIAKRLSLTRQQVQFMLKDEVKAALFDGVVHPEVLDERLKSCVMHNKNNFEKVYIGAEADIFRQGIKKDFDDSQTEFKGQTAQPGFATGTAKVIIRAKDMAKMNTGDILVSIATDPDIVPAMKKAAAIITEQGGITSHAAIVSRELGTPCIIGTKIATKVLKDGDLVEVDANKGVVKILKRK